MRHVLLSLVLLALGAPALVAEGCVERIGVSSCVSTDGPVPVASTDAQTAGGNATAAAGVGAGAGGAAEVVVASGLADLEAWWSLRGRTFGIDAGTPVAAASIRDERGIAVCGDVGAGAFALCLG